LSFIADASVAAAWVLPDENEPAADLLLRRAMADGVTVPFHWPAEIANVLVMAERRGRITRDQMLEAHLLLISVAPTVDQGGAIALALDAATTAHLQGLSVYDALYLELAERTALPLATFDKRLRGAAEKASISLLP